MKTILIISSILLLSINVFSQKEVNALHFGFDVSELTTENKQALDNLIPKLKQSKITLKGYTDFIGSSGYNNKLSNKRVNSVKQYLLTKGITENSIEQSVGLGELTEFKDRAKNRRVDIFLEEVVKEIVEVKEEVMEEIIEEVVEVKEPSLSIEEISSLEVGESFALEGMEFIPGRHFLQEYSKSTLVELLDILNEKPNLKIEIQGHICCDHSGNDGLDWDTQTRNLSKNRAKYIYDYLVFNKISKDRLSYKGFGSSRPLVEEITPADQQKNRRVEIMIVEK